MSELLKNLSEMDEIIDSIKDMQDRVLDVYKHEPVRSKKLLEDLELLKADAKKLYLKFSSLI